MRHKNLSNGKMLQWQEQSTRVEIWNSTGEPQEPLTRQSPEPAMNNHQHVSDLLQAAPSRLGGGNHQE
jgi:hypothetical protein